MRRPIKSKVIEDEELDAIEELDEPKSINDLYSQTSECATCFFSESCPKVNQGMVCQLVADSKIDLSTPATIQGIQQEIVEDTVKTLKRHEELFRRGILDDIEALHSMRRSVFDLMEKLKKSTSVKGSEHSATEKLGLGKALLNVTTPRSD